MQAAFNLALALSGIFGGWWLKTLQESLRELRSNDKDLLNKVQQIEVLVAGQYVPRDEFEKMSNSIFDSLRRIEEKISEKADR